jgi:iron complex outermembrane receptor protein
MAVITAALGQWLGWTIALGQPVPAPVMAIAPQPLGQALAMFAKQTGLQVVYVSGTITGATSKGAPNGLTPTDTLIRLLEGTGLTFEFLNERTVRIFRGKPAPQAVGTPAEGAKPGVVEAGPVSPVVDGTKNYIMNDQKGGNPMTSRTKQVGILARISGFFALCGPLLSAGTAYCQQAQTSQVNEPDQLQEVIVTAERREIDVQRTPIAMTVVSGDDLRAQQINDIQDLQAVTPGLSVDSTGGYQFINIRGVGLQTIFASASAGVAVIHDGLPNVSNGEGIGGPLYDIADVEVLRGPQGTFEGSNSTGGAIQINSQNPNFRGLNGYAEAQVGNYSDHRFDGAVNLPLTDTIAARIAFNEETRGSFYYDVGAQNSGPDLGGAAPGGYPGGSSRTQIDPGNLNELNGRVSLLWKPIENFQALAKFEFNSDVTDGTPDQPNPNTFAPLPGLPCPNGNPAPPCYSVYYAGYSGNPWVINSWDQALNWKQFDNAQSLELRYTLPDGIVLRSMGGAQELYTTYQANPTADSINYGYTNNLEGDNIYNEELDLISPATGNFTWIAGTNWFYHLASPLTQYTVVSSPPFSAAAPRISISPNLGSLTRQGAVFGQVSWQFTRTLQLQVGARENWDNNPGYGYVEVIKPGTSPPYAHLGTPLAYVGNTPTGKVDLNWTPVQGQNFYVFWARGYKPGTTNGTTNPANDVLSLKESVDDYEIGWKGRLADGHVLTQVDGYYMNYSDMQQLVFDIYSPGSFSDISNIPHSTIKGLEASAQTAVGRLGFNLSANYNKSALGSLEDTAAYKFPLGYGTTAQCAAGVSPLPGNTNCTNYLPYQENLTGEELPYAPEWTVNSSVQYSIPFGSNALVPRLAYSYTSKQYASLFQTDNFYLMNTRHLWNAYLDYIAGPWKVTAYGTNLGNELYASGYSTSSTTATTDIYYGNPRQFGLRVNRTF